MKTTRRTLFSKFISYFIITSAIALGLILVPRLFFDGLEYFNFHLYGPDTIDINDLRQAVDCPVGQSHFIDGRLFVCIAMKPTSHYPEGSGLFIEQPTVLSYGADPTGIHDSTRAIQKAIDSAIDDAAPIDSRGGGMVFFPPGTYRIDKKEVNGEINSRKEERQPENDDAQAAIDDAYFSMGSYEQQVVGMSDGMMLGPEPVDEWVISKGFVCPEDHGTDGVDCFPAYDRLVMSGPITIETMWPYQLPCCCMEEPR